MKKRTEYRIRRLRHLWLLPVWLISVLPAGADSAIPLPVGGTESSGYVGESLEILSEQSIFEHHETLDELPEDFRDLILSGQWSSNEEISVGIQRTQTGGYRLNLSRIGTDEKAVVEWGIEDVLNGDVSALFTASDDEIPLLDFTAHAFWFRLRLHNTLSEPVQMVLELDKNTYSWFDLMYFQDGASLFLSGSYEDPMSRRVIQENKIFFPVLLDPGVQDLYLRMDSQLMDTVPIRIWETDSYYRRNNISKYFHGFTSGAAMLLFIYALFLAYTWKERGYLYLAFQILFGMLVHLSESGLGKVIFWPESPMGSIYLISLAFPLIIIANLLFCRHYLPVKRYTPVVDRILIAMIFAAGLLAITQFFIPINSRFLFTLIAILLDYLSVIPLLFAAIVAFRREPAGNRPSIFLLAAISFQLVSYLEFWLSRLNIIPLGLIDFLHLRSVGFALVMLGGQRFKVRSLEKAITSLRGRLDEIVAQKSINSSEKTLTDQTLLKVEAVKELIEKNYTEALYRDNLAASVGLSQDHLGRMFKRLTGVKISEYLNRVRIEEACRRLELDTGKIIDIAFDVGFENLRTFNLCFMKNTGTSPSEYRKKVAVQTPVGPAGKPLH